MQTKILADGDRFPALDGLRGVAALMVLITHSSNANMHLVPGLNLTGMGRMFLLLFFVLSAFLLTDQAVRAYTRGAYVAWSLAYLLKRFFRIYPLFIAAVLIDVFLNRMATSEAINAFTLTIGKGIFWSIPPEFQYYFLIPILAYLLSRDVRIGLPVCAVIIGISFVCYSSLQVWPYLMLFVTSSLAAYLFRKRVAFCRCVGYLAPITIGAIVVMIPCVIRKLFPNVDPMSPRDFLHVAAIVWAPVIYACAFNFKGMAFLASKPMRFVGSISFGIYLLRPLVIIAAQALGMAGKLTSGMAVLIGSLIVGYIARKLIEEPGRVLGYRYAERLSHTKLNY